MLPTGEGWGGVWRMSVTVVGGRKEANIFNEEDDEECAPHARPVPAPVAINTSGRGGGWTDEGRTGAMGGPTEEVVLLGDSPPQSPNPGA